MTWGRIFHPTDARAKRQGQLSFLCKSFDPHLYSVFHSIQFRYFSLSLSFSSRAGWSFKSIFYSIWPSVAICQMKYSTQLQTTKTTRTHSLTLSLSSLKLAQSLELNLVLKAFILSTFYLSRSLGALSLNSTTIHRWSCRMFLQCVYVYVCVWANVTWVTRKWEWMVRW